MINSHHLTPTILLAYASVPLFYGCAAFCGCLIFSLTGFARVCQRAPPRNSTTTEPEIGLLPTAAPNVSLPLHSTSAPPTPTTRDVIEADDIVISRSQLIAICSFVMVSLVIAIVIVALVVLFARHCHPFNNSK